LESPKVKNNQKEALRKRRLTDRIDRPLNQSKKPKGSCTGGLVRSIGRSESPKVKKNQKEALRKRRLTNRIDRPSNRSKKTTGSCTGGLVRSIGRSAFESVQKTKGSCAGGLVQSIGRSALRIGPKKQNVAAPEGWFSQLVDWPSNPSTTTKMKLRRRAGSMDRSIGLRIGPKNKRKLRQRASSIDRIDRPSNRSKKQKEAAPEGWFD